MDKPILFNTEMVQAILEGRKTQTRRIIKPQPGINEECFGRCTFSTERKDVGKVVFGIDNHMKTYTKLPYQVGDILYVRETWAEVTSLSDPFHSGGNALAAGIDSWFYYKADNKKLPNGFKWHPSIHMPKGAARIRLRVTDVKPERVQEITEDDAIAEGIGGLFLDEIAYSDNPKYEVPMERQTLATDQFELLWNSIYDERGQGWDKNPWVWKITFERTDKP
jgi:hypothetical protein